MSISFSRRFVLKNNCEAFFQTTIVFLSGPIKSQYLDTQIGILCTKTQILLGIILHIDPPQMVCKLRAKAKTKNA